MPDGKQIPPDVERLDRRIDLRGITESGLATSGATVLIAEALGKDVSTKWIGVVRRADREHVVSVYGTSPGGVLHRLAELFDAAQDGAGWATRNDLIRRDLESMAASNYS